MTAAVPPDRLPSDVVTAFPGQLARAAAARRIDLSFVIPACNEDATIAEAIGRVADEAARLGRGYEILVVDDGSTDETVAVARALIDACHVRVIRLSRNFGKEQAIMAGLRRAHGAAVVILDADLQEPLDCLATMLAEHDAGFEMVYAVRADRADETLAKRGLTRAFYWLLSRGSEVPIPPDARDFRLMDRKVVDALCAMPERNRFMKGLYGWVGFRTKAVPIKLERRRGGRSKFGFRRLAALALTGLTAFTDWPLRIWTSLGFGVAVLSMLYGGWIATRTLVLGAEVPGWSTLAVGMFFLGGIQLISIGILGEYLARVYTEVKRRPGHIVAEEFGPGDCP